MIHTLRILILVGWAATIAAQPTIQWQKTFGGSLYDEAQSIKQTPDGGYIVVGTTLSSDGDIFGHRGGNDLWALKLNSNGAIQWKKVIGGSNNEYVRCVQLTTDGGYIIAGYTASNNLDVSGNHGGYFDAWIVKLSSNGTMEWQKPLGGSGYDRFWSVQQAADNGFIAVGRTDSQDGDVTEIKGKIDLWVVKLTEIGDIQWEKSFGGSQDDSAYGVQVTSDGGYIVVGETASNDGDVTGLHGNVDFWVLKLDAEGNLEWQKTLGGENGDIGSSVLQTENGDYIVVGFVGSINSGDVTSHDEMGLFDMWVVQLSNNGELIWQKTIGGTNPDYGREVVATNDGHFLVVGSTDSENGDITSSNGLGDFWLVKISNTGELMWQKTYGGTKADHGFAIDHTSDNGFIMAGYSWSNDGDLGGSLNRGKNDFCVIKLSPESISSQNTPHTTETLQISPNPARQYANIEVPTQENSVFVTLSDLLGRVVLAQEMDNHSTLNTAGLNPGVYFVTAKTDNGQVFRGKLEKTP